MNIFTTTYIVLFGNSLNGDIVKFSDFNSVDDFKNYLDKSSLRYDIGEGDFVSDFDGESYSFFICEKEYYEKTGLLTNWGHPALKAYFNLRSESSVTWVEDYESVWAAVCDGGDEGFQDIFDDIKSIDGVEIEVEFSYLGYLDNKEMRKYYRPTAESLKSPEVAEMFSTKSVDESDVTETTAEPETKPAKKKVKKSYEEKLMDEFIKRGIKDVTFETPVNVEVQMFYRHISYTLARRYVKTEVHKISLRYDDLFAKYYFVGDNEYIDIMFEKEEYDEIIRQMKSIFKKTKSKK